MEKKYVLQGLSIQKEKDLPSLLNQAAILFVALTLLFIIPIDKCSFGIISLIAIVNVSIISKVLLKQYKMKYVLDATVNKFDNNLKLFFIKFSSALSTKKFKEYAEVIKIIDNISLYHEVKKITYSYSDNPSVKNNHEISISNDLSQSDVIRIYSEVLEFIIVDYIKSNNYTPKSFSEVGLYKICKELVSYVYYYKNKHIEKAK